LAGRGEFLFGSLAAYDRSDGTLSYSSFTTEVAIKLLLQLMPGDCCALLIAILLDGMLRDALVTLRIDAGDNRELGRVFESVISICAVLNVFECGGTEGRDWTEGSDEQGNVV